MAEPPATIPPEVIPPATTPPADRPVAAPTEAAAGMAARSAGFDLERFLPYRLNVLASRVSRDLARQYEQKFGISIPEWRVLAHLAQNRDVSVREIHERVDMDKSKVSRAAARLESLALIEKREHAGDRRLVDLRLTARGLALFAEIAPLALAFEADLFAALDAEERRVFERVMTKLLGEGPVVPAPGGSDAGG